MRLNTRSLSSYTIVGFHNGVMIWKHFSSCWPFIKRIHRLLMDSSKKASNAKHRCFFEMRLIKPNQALEQTVLPVDRNIMTLSWRQCDVAMKLFSPKCFSPIVLHQQLAHQLFPTCHQFWFIYDATPNIFHWILLISWLYELLYYISISLYT